MDDAITRLDELLLDDPFSGALTETMVVAGDLLQSRGDLRGEHIAYELALARADAETRPDRVRDYAAWLEAHERRLFGKLGPLRHRRGAMRCGFRGGKLHALSLDLRRVIRHGIELRVDELVGLALDARIVRDLRELRVRVRSEYEVAAVYATLLASRRELPLEVLMVSPTTRPLGHHSRGSATQLRERFPQLWFSTRFAHVSSLLDAEIADETTAHEIAQLHGVAIDRSVRVHVGRGLSSGRRHTTKAACDLLAELGASGRVFAPILDLLLRRRVSHAAAWLLPELPRFGPWVRELLPRVRSITGDSANYPVEVRAAAGHCLARFEAKLDAVK